jgi:hypothetical protein
VSEKLPVDELVKRSEGETRAAQVEVLRGWGLGLLELQTLGMGDKSKA